MSERQPELKACNIAAAARARVIRQAAGLEAPTQKHTAKKAVPECNTVPTLLAFQKIFRRLGGSSEGESTRHGQVLP
jgi:hypothetical protein